MIDDDVLPTQQIIPEPVAEEMGQAQPALQQVFDEAFWRALADED